jgi:DNA polymerase-3 subunit delta
MITTLTGANSFGLHHELDSLVAEFLAEHDAMGLERLDGEEADYNRLQEAVTSLPFLATKKLVILRSPGANKKFAENAEHLLTEVPETSDVIVIEPKLDKRSSYYKFLKKATNYQEFAELDIHGLARWLTDYAKANGGSVSLADARLLVERVGVNQQLLSNEIDKLLLHTSTVSRQTIMLLTEPTPQSTIFELLEAAFAGNSRRTIALYQEQRALKVEPQQIIAMLAWQLHIVALAKTAGNQSADQIAKAAKLSPYVVKKSQAIARGVPAPELKQLIQQLLTIDRRLCLRLQAELSLFSHLRKLLI